MSEPAPQSNHIELMADMVSAYVSNNQISPVELTALIASVNGALNKADRSGKVEPEEELKPAVPVKKSVTADHIVCLFDGKKFKSLKRHLCTAHNLTPEEYGVSGS